MSNYNENASEPSASAEGLETINDDCLRPIFNYSNIMDVVNLASTSKRLHSFAISDYFPKNAKHIIIEKNNHGIITLTAPFNNGFTMEIQSTQKLKYLFSYFGEYVENLTFRSICFERLNPTQKSKVMLIFVNVMELCQYMKTLSFENCSTTLEEIREILYGSEMSKNLKELEFFNTNHLTFKGILKVDILTLSVENKVISHFFEYYVDLFIFTVEFVCQTRGRGDREMICDLCGNGLKNVLDNIHWSTYPKKFYQNKQGWFEKTRILEIGRFPWLR